MADPGQEFAEATRRAAERLLRRAVDDVRRYGVDIPLRTAYK